MNKIILSLIFILFTNGFIFSQEKVSATFEAVEGKVLIYYTVKGDPEKEYDVNVVLKRSGDSSFELVPENMSGDVGKGKFAGSRKTIIWNIKPEEEAQLEGEDFYFEVTAAEIKESSFPWLWVIGGAAVAGGTAAYFILSGNKTEETANLPGPPGRP
ncbi:MAG: hypothetical protein A2V93_04025 [Ignavibacteria bacterium RBG_16_34_14]|nr:MAG: hypothetical protein A2V93_04025 [Ignavibacteria bacterium RBG_16_34_14]